MAKRRVALARLLLQHPDLLLLDEPTNHLDAESVEWLERFLSEYAGTVVAITHDRYFLDNVAQWILELDRGGESSPGNYSSWLEQKLGRMAREQKQVDARQRTLARELEWVRMGAKARQAKGKARLTAYEKLLEEANDARGVQQRELEIAIPPGPRLGDTVIEVNGLRKGYGDRLLIEDLTFTAAGRHRRHHRAERRRQDDALPDARGPGAARRRDDRDRRHGRAQLRRPEPRRPGGRQDRLPGDHPGAEVIKVGSRELPARAYVSSFNFRGTDQQKMVGTLSGGRGTVSTWPSSSSPAATCSCWTSRPTTSTSTRCAPWKPASESFPGCVVVISHDRWFLDRIATHILAFEGESQVRFFQGNVSDYEAFRRKELERRRSAAPDPLQAPGSGVIASTRSRDERRV